MEALRAGDDIKRLVRIRQFIRGAYHKLRAADPLSLRHADHLVGQIRAAIARRPLLCKKFRQKSRSAADVQERFIGKIPDLPGNIPAADLPVLRIIICVSLIIFGRLTIKMLFG